MKRLPPVLLNETQWSVGSFQNVRVSVVFIFLGKIRVLSVAEMHYGQFRRYDKGNKSEAKS